MSDWSLIQVSKREVYRDIVIVSKYILNLDKVKDFSARLSKYIIEESEKNEIWVFQCGIMK